MDVAASCINQIYEDGPELFQELSRCAHSQDNAMRDKLRIRTRGVNLAQTPEIVIDGLKRTPEAGLDIISYLCRSFEPIKPRVCFNIEDSTKSLQVTVYLTADQQSQTFVQSQISPLLTNQTRDSAQYLRDVIEWNFVPWGSSVYNSTSGELECTNGEEECLANRILTCATRLRQNGRLGVREDKSRVVSFVACFFDSATWQSNPLQAANLCSPKLSPLDIYPQLWQCAVQDSKLKFLLEMKTLTDNNYPAIASCEYSVCNTSF